MKSRSSSTSDQDVESSDDSKPSLPANFLEKWSYSSSPSSPSTSKFKDYRSPGKLNGRAKTKEEEAIGTPSSLKRSSSPLSTSKGKKQRKGYSDPELHSHLKPLPDILAENLDILFCGINPGIQSATQSHHFAHPTNQFYPSLFHSSITSTLLPPSSDYLFPTLKPLQLGLTNLCSRPTVSSTGLSAQELFESVPGFMKKVQRCRPKVVCFVGKGVGGMVEKWVRSRESDQEHRKDYGKASKGKFRPQDLGRTKSSRNGGDGRRFERGTLFKEDDDNEDLHYSDLKDDLPIFHEKERNAYGFMEFCLVHSDGIEDEDQVVKIEEGNRFSGTESTLQTSALSYKQQKSETEVKESLRDARANAEIKAEEVLSSTPTSTSASQTQVTLFFCTPSTSGRVTSSQLKDKITWMKKLRENVMMLVGKEDIKFEPEVEKNQAMNNKSPIKVGKPDEKGLRLVSFGDKEEGKKEEHLKRYGFRRFFL